MPLNVNFADVPDTVPLVSPGTHQFVIEGSPKLTQGDGDQGPWERLSIPLKCLDDGDDKGRMVWDSVFTTSDPDSRDMVRLKKLLEAVGIDPAPGVDESELASKIVLAEIYHAKDKRGEPVANVRRYLPAA